MQIITLFIVLLIGFFTGIFVYRKNPKRLDPITDEIEKLSEEVAEKVKKKMREKKD